MIGNQEIESATGRLTGTHTTETNKKEMKILYQIVALDTNNEVHHYVGDTFEQREEATHCLNLMSEKAKSLYRYEIQEIKLK